MTYHTLDSGKDGVLPSLKPNTTYIVVEQEAGADYKIVSQSSSRSGGLLRTSLQIIESKPQPTVEATAAEAAPEAPKPVKIGAPRSKETVKVDWTKIPGIKGAVTSETVAEPEQAAEEAPAAPAEEPAEPSPEKPRARRRN